MYATKLLTLAMLQSHSKFKAHTANTQPLKKHLWAETVESLTLAPFAAGLSMYATKLLTSGRQKIKMCGVIWQQQQRQQQQQQQHSRCHRLIESGCLAEEHMPALPPSACRCQKLLTSGRQSLTPAAQPQMMVNGRYLQLISHQYPEPYPQQLVDGFEHVLVTLFHLTQSLS
jgi:hypothetical protein